MKNRLVDIFYYFSFIASFAIGIFYFLIYKSEMVGFFVYIVTAPIMLLTPIFIQKIKAVQQNYNKNLSNIIKLSVSTIVYLHGLGSLGLYNKSFEYDQIAHFMTLIFVMIMLAFFFRIITVDILNKKEFPPLIVLPVLFILGVLGGILTEIVQFSSDYLFGSAMFFDKDQIINIDVLTDMRANALGSLVGLIFLKIKWKKLKLRVLKNPTSI